jgi:hypothetical protein
MKFGTIHLNSLRPFPSVKCTGYRVEGIGMRRKVNVPQLGIRVCETECGLGLDDTDLKRNLSQDCGPLTGPSYNVNFRICR